MTNEEKARAFDEALERAKMILCNIPYGSTSIKDIETIFPELRESEDERIRRWLVELVENQEPKVFIEVKKMDVFAYLEKQKDLKYSEEHMEDIRQYAYNKGIMDEREKQTEPHFTKRNALFDKCVENCDPEIMKRVSDEIDAQLEKEQKRDGGDDYNKGYIDGRAASWKPSEEQMEALRRAVNKLAKTDVADSVRLSIMYDNLKKLM